MDLGELSVLTEALVDALAEATAHEPCEEPCLLCGDAGTDLYSVLTGLERALGNYFTMPEARASHAAEEVEALFERLREAEPYRYAVPPGQAFLPTLDARSAQRLYVYLKAVALDLTHASGWPRIET